jgi:predicted DNA-binding antitoxin AbrB/MazE fold protein
MTNPTIEGIVENGQIRLLENVRLPENTRVYVVVAESNASRASHLRSPRLAHPEQARDFVKQVFEVSTDARL